MFEISETAQDKIQGMLKEANREGLSLRVEIAGRTQEDFLYRLFFVSEAHRQEDDTVIDCDSVQVLVDPYSARYLQGSTLNYQEEDGETGFKIDNPNPLWFNDLAASVHQVIETRVNPGVAMHGGRVNLLDVQDDVAYISMGGGCQGCGMADVTLKQGVETAIKQAVPQIKQIVDTTQHEMGKNPYYASAREGESPLAK